MTKITELTSNALTDLAQAIGLMDESIRVLALEIHVYKMTLGLPDETHHTQVVEEILRLRKAAGRVN